MALWLCLSTSSFRSDDRRHGSSMTAGSPAGGLDYYQNLTLQLLLGHTTSQAKVPFAGSVQYERNNWDDTEAGR